MSLTPCCLAVSRKNALVHVGGANMKDTDVTLFETPDVGDEHGGGNAREEQVSEHQAWGGQDTMAGRRATGKGAERKRSTDAGAALCS